MRSDTALERVELGEDDGIRGCASVDSGARVDGRRLLPASALAPALAPSTAFSFASPAAFAPAFALTGGNFYEAGGLLRRSRRPWG